MLEGESKKHKVAEPFCLSGPVPTLPPPELKASAVALPPDVVVFVTTVLSLNNLI